MEILLLNLSYRVVHSFKFLPYLQHQLQFSTKCNDMYLLCQSMHRLYFFGIQNSSNITEFYNKLSESF